LPKDFNIGINAKMMKFLAIPTLALAAFSNVVAANSKSRRLGNQQQVGGGNRLVEGLPNSSERSFLPGVGGLNERMLKKAKESEKKKSEKKKKTPQPTKSPTKMPTSQPTTSQPPSASPSAQPTVVPSAPPSSKPSSRPSAAPSLRPSSFPSDQPSSLPTLTAMPSLQSKKKSMNGSMKKNKGMTKARRTAVYVDEDEDNIYDWWVNNNVA
jgi:hypothetical protein